MHIAKRRRESLHFALFLAVPLLFTWSANPLAAQPLTGDNVTLDSVNPFTRIADVGGVPGDFYEVVPTTNFLEVHTNTTRIDPSLFAPFRVRYTAAPGLMTLRSVGLTLGAPSQTAALLHLRADGADEVSIINEARLVVENFNTTSEPRTMIEMINSGGARFGFTNSDTGQTWAFQNNASDGFLINLLGSGGNEMSIRKTGLVTMGPGGIQNFLLDPVGNLTVLGTVNPSSDRNMKEGFREINESDVLARIAEMPVTEWNYKKDGDEIRHIGPVSQDFHAAFQVGKDDRTISVTDASGVAFAGIKALNQRCNDLATKCEGLSDQCAQKDKTIERLESSLQELNQRMAALEALIPQ